MHHLVLWHLFLSSCCGGGSHELHSDSFCEELDIFHPGKVIYYLLQDFCNIVFHRTSMSCFLLPSESRNLQQVAPPRPFAVLVKYNIRTGHNWYWRQLSRSPRSYPSLPTVIFWHRLLKVSNSLDESHHAAYLPLKDIVSFVMSQSDWIFYKCECFWEQCSIHMAIIDISVVGKLMAHCHFFGGDTW